MNIRIVWRWIFWCAFTMMLMLMLHYASSSSFHAPLPTKYLVAYCIESIVIGAVLAIRCVCNIPRYSRLAVKLFMLILFVGGLVQMYMVVKKDQPCLVYDVVAIIGAFSVFCAVSYFLLKDRRKNEVIFLMAKTGKGTFTDEQWLQLECSMVENYPGFIHRLNGLTAMNRVEYNLCLLIRIGVTPARMAELLCRSKQSITSIRSRLYAKHFQQGSARDWDQFIMKL